MTKILTKLKVLVLCKLLHWHNWEKGDGQYRSYYMRFKTVYAYFAKRVPGDKFKYPYEQIVPVKTYQCTDCGKVKTMEDKQKALKMVTEHSNDSLSKYK